VSPELLGFVLLAVFFAAIFIGFPVAFTLIVLSLAFGYFALGDIVSFLTVFQTLGLMKEEVLAAFAAHKHEVTAGYMAAPRQGV
jgi:TRAP-type mannitol/chloroaromatic compound transport system permease large subunit